MCVGSGADMGGDGDGDGWRRAWNGRETVVGACVGRRFLGLRDDSFLGLSVQIFFDFLKKSN